MDGTRFGKRKEVSLYLDKQKGLRLNYLQAMQIACEQAELGLEQTSPNPCVGSVILDSRDSIVGLGYHKKFGGPHAEVEALSSVKDQEALRDSTILVTLEPCAHQGKTPSCAKNIATLSGKITRVIYLIKDPNPKVSGAGHKILEEAGVSTFCVEDILNNKKYDEKDLVSKFIHKNKKLFFKLIKKQKYLNRHFLYAMNSELPYITIKWAQTLDGTIGLKDKRLIITNESVKNEVHHLRACHDIVLVGKGTIIADNPMLNNRFGSSRHKLNRIAILDSNLEVLTQIEKLNIFKVHAKENLIFITSKDTKTEVYEDMGFKFIKTSNEINFGINIKQALVELKNIYKINSVFVEGGSRTIESMLNNDLCNEVYLFSSFKFFFKIKTIRFNWFLVIKKLFLNTKFISLKFFENNFLIHVTKY